MTKFILSAALSAWAILASVAAITIHVTDTRQDSNSQACFVARQAFLNSPIVETEQYVSISKQVIEVCK